MSGDLDSSRAKNLCAVNCASFVSRSLVGDHQWKDGQSRRAAIDFGDRLLQDLEVRSVWSGKMGQ